VPNGIVSFGQGCEGDPLLAAHVIEPAIRFIRTKTQNGTINMNTNGSRPDTLQTLFAAGLDSIRISMNSVRESCYHAYFRPVDYRFSDVIAAIGAANREGKRVFINYLNFPGVTDTFEELLALTELLRQFRIDLIQWRNLNIDPLEYMRAMNRVAEQGQPLGMLIVIENIRQEFPELRHGYFNPAKETFR
jgi:molybdenum cofactor biosynthesis enzyme MoaA